MPLNLTLCRYIYGIFLIAIAVLFGVQLAGGKWLQTDLQALLPKDQHWAEVQKQADHLQEQQLNKQVIALVGHSDPQQAFISAEKVAQNWQQSTLFQQIDFQTQPSLEQLRTEISLLKFALLPNHIKQQLLNQPKDYFQHYAEQIANPFGQTNLLSLEQDWLGFGRFVLAQSQNLSALQWNSENGTIYREVDGITWILVRGELSQANIINPQQDLLQLVEQSQLIAQQQGGELLITGTSLFASLAKQQAESESTLMSVLGISLTLLLLVGAFRSIRVLWLFLPIGIGMLCGVVATIALFGHIHILTLVIGTSLIGVLIDFPLHWLASSLFATNWQPTQAMAKLRFTFLVSLLVTLLGYGLLGFTALPVLQQTALFSAVALVGAICATMLYLPHCFANFQPRKRSFFAINLPSINPLWQKVGATMLLIFVACGLYQSKWQDDIRQWVSMPTMLLQQAQKIGEITGINLGNQYFLVIAQNNEELLNKEQRLIDKLQLLQNDGKIEQYQGLSQWIVSIEQQQQFANQLINKIQAEDYAILQEIGVPETEIKQAIQALSNKQFVGLEQALNTQLGQGWQNLYFNNVEQNYVASLVKVSGIKDSQHLIALANHQDIYWQDKRADLNQQFQQTRDQAAWLKLISFALASLLLWRLFGFKAGVKLLAIPLSAIVITIAIFGWLGISINLFAMFGLLLVSAIGIDYTAYMQTAKEPLNAKRVAVSLAALTTLISFMLLSLSSTPAVASFGLSVSIGVLFSVLITFKFLR
ncbi:hypothetical protein BMT54_04145 [Pasteurellaceae bacterium 15-036681]|nr:hypothetical protein BMT54_04145 [Pasteurellaceae bacterium 15-036681]